MDAKVSLPSSLSLARWKHFCGLVAVRESERLPLVLASDNDPLQIAIPDISHGYPLIAENIC